MNPADYKNLSRDEKIKLIDAIEEKKRRIKNQKPIYIPNKGQLKVHEDPKPIRFCTAGNGGGKTTMAVQEAWWAAKGYNPVTGKTTRVPAKIIVLVDGPQKVRDLWVPAFQEWFDFKTDVVKTDKHGKAHIVEITLKNGSTITFMLHDQPEQVFEGIELDTLICDEPFGRHIWTALTRGMRKKHSNPRTLIIGTPLGQPWMYKELWLPAEKGIRTDIGLHTFSNKVNEDNLADGYLDAFARNLTEAEKKIRMEGQFGVMEGFALAHMFDEDIHVVDDFEFPRRWPVVIGLDPHQAKPHHACMLGADPEGNYWYLKELVSKSPPEQFAQELKEWYHGYNVRTIICDSFGNIPATGGDGRLSFIEKLQKCGVPLHPTTFKDKSDDDFMQRIRQILEIPVNENNFGKRLPKIRIARSCRGIINDINFVQWQKEKRGEDGYKNKLEISDKDFLATLKYALAASLNLFFHKPRTLRTTNPSPWSGGARKKA